MEKVELCKYCEVGDVEPSIHFLCEGRWCESAKERMEEELELEKCYYIMLNGGCKMNNEEKLAELYQEERNEFGILPNSDSDMEAYVKALTRLQQENKNI